MTSLRAAGIRFGPLGRNCVHLCVDMQRIFAEDTDWNTPWMPQILPRVDQIVATHPEATIFTRFVTPETPAEAPGVWQRYYERWHRLTRAELAPGLLDLVEPLSRHIPPSRIFDKRTYSPWIGSELEALLRRQGTDTVIVSGGETDVCVLGTVLGAIDRGFRTLIVTDAVCSSSDETHDALLRLYESRFGQQVETVSTEVLLQAWV